jgi:hypothetical protein
LADGLEVLVVVVPEDPGRLLDDLESILRIRGRFYDFKNIFAEKNGEKTVIILLFFLNRQFFSHKIGQNRQKL